MTARIANQCLQLERRGNLFTHVGTSRRILGLDYTVEQAAASCFVGPALVGQGTTGLVGFDACETFIGVWNLRTSIGMGATVGVICVICIIRIICIRGRGRGRRIRGRACVSRSAVRIGAGICGRLTIAVCTRLSCRLVGAVCACFCAGVGTKRIAIAARVGTCTGCRTCTVFFATGR